MIKVCSGVIKSDDVLYNVDQESEEKLSKLYVLEGSKPIEVPELSVPSQNSAMQEPAIPLRQRTIRSATENRMFRLRTPQNDINRRTKPM